MCDGNCKGKRLSGYQIESMVGWALTAIAAIVAIVAVAFLIEHAGERHQVTKAQQKIVCMENAQNDTTLLACHKTL